MSLLLDILIKMFQVYQNVTRTELEEVHTHKISPLKVCDIQTFDYNAILDWNNLPEDIKSIENRTAYKTGQSNEARSVNHF